MNTFLQAQEDGDQGDVIMHHDQPLYRSAATVSRSLRTIFGEHQIKAFVSRSSPDLKSGVILWPVNDRLGLTTDRYSPLLQEFSMLFCCEQAFHGSADACSQVFGHQLSVNTLQKVSRRLAERADQFLQTREAPPPVEEGELLVMTADGKGVPLVQQDAQQLWAFEDRPQRPGNRRMATLAVVYPVDRFVRKPQEIVSALFREECTDLKLTRPRPQHQRLNARLPSTVEGLDDEIIRGSIQSLTWADREV